MKKPNLQNRLFLILLLGFVAMMLQSRQCYAALEQFTGSNHGTLNVNDTFSVKDDKYFTVMAIKNPLNWGFKNYNVKNKVSLNINYLSTAYLSTKFTVTCSLEISYNKEGVYPSGGIPPLNQKKYVELKITYDNTNGSKHIDDNTFAFEGAHHFIVKIISINTSVPVNANILRSLVRIDGNIDVTRYYQKLNPSVRPVFLSYTNTNPHELTVQWMPDSAEHYELEWMWLDFYKSNLYTSKFHFQDSCTRVTVNGSSYTIPLIYEKGYLVCRVRGIRRGGANYEHIVPGLWSIENNTTSLQSLGISPGINPVINYVYFISTTYEEIKNWQYSVGFAEEGKKQTVVSFFDGTLRSRQTVSKNYTNNESIVSENIYDHLGRQAINVIPSPTGDNLLAYHANFNLNNSLNPYSWEDFERVTDTSVCHIKSALPMSTNSGASRYYSNAVIYTDLHKYLPNAFGKPFAQTEYLNDNTGRVRRQSGVGPDMQLGTGHETKYFYGQPTQYELDKLFGSNVGYASRYKKNTVVDPNGQISITYLDAHGRTVATSLAGDGAPNMDKLDGNIAPLNTVTTQLIDGLGSVKSTSYATAVLNYPIDVVKAENRTFTYQFKPEKFTDFCYAPANVCFDCAYDLEIKIVDDCGRVIKEATRTIGKLPADTICSDDLDTINQVINVFMQVGHYTIHKALRVNKEAMEFYAEQYVKQDTCVREFNSFYKEEAAKIDFSGCNTSCPTCENYNGCEAQYEAMLADVSPGGQYAEYYVINGDTTFTKNFRLPLSVLNSYDNKLPNDSANWRFPKTPYKNSEGIPDTIVYLGIKYAPQDLPNDSLFVLFWKSSWAESLVKYHPEYGYYEWCKLNRQNGSEGYDSALIELEDYDTAKAKGYFNPLAVTSTVPTVYQSPSITDPFFAVNNPGYPMRSYMISKMQEYVRSKNDVPYSMWQVAIAAAMCKDISLELPINGNASPNLKSCLDNYNANPGNCNNHMVWKYFKYLYLSEKWKIKNVLSNEYAINKKCYNGCIGDNSGPSFQYKTLDINGDEHIETCFDNVSLPPYCPISQKYAPAADSRQPCSIFTSELYSKKTRRFNPSFEIFGVNVLDKNKESINDRLQDTAKANIDKNCDKQCKSYADQWMYALRNCNGITDQTKYNNLRTALIEICKKGCDINNPLGASSIAPGKTNTYQNFTEAIQGILGITPDPNCNSLLITMPYPFGHNYELSQDTYNPNDCEGEKVPSKTCIYCIPLYNAFKNFETTYNIPETAANYEVMLTNYMNRSFNRTLTFTDYLEMQLNCDINEPAPDNCNLVPDTSLHLLNLFNSLYSNDALILHEDSIYNLGTDTLFSGFFQLFGSYKLNKPTMMVIDNHYNGGYFKAEIRDLSGRVCELKLVFPSHGFQLKNIVSFQGVRFDPANANDQHAFIIDVLYDNGTNTVLVPVRAKTPCWTVALCNGNSQQQFICSEENLGKSTPPAPNKRFVFSSEGNNPPPYWKVAPTSSCGCSKIFDIYDAFLKNPGQHPNFTEAFNSAYPDNKTKNSSIYDPEIILTRCLGYLNNPAMDRNTFNRSQVSYNTQTQDAMELDDKNNSVPPSNGKPSNYGLPAVLSAGCNGSNGGGGAGGGSTCTSCDEIGENLLGTMGYLDTMARNDRFYNILSESVSRRYNKTLRVVPAIEDSLHPCATCSKPAIAVCTDATKEAKALVKLFNELIVNQKFINLPAVVTNYQSFKPLKSSSPACINYNYNGSVNPTGSIYSATIISDCNTTCNINIGFSGVAGTFNFAQVDSFRNIIPIKGKKGTIYTFKMEAFIGGLSYNVEGSNDYYPISECCTYQTMCNKPQRLTLDTTQCRKVLLDIAMSNANHSYDRYIDSVKNSFRDKYVQKCMSKPEFFTMEYKDYQYQYTLFYYDQAGNLVRTVPPKGVQVIANVDTVAVNNNRRSPTNPSYPLVLTNHTLPTSYRYNSLNQLVWQNTPDAGESNFWYDNLGRIVASQNSKQVPGGKYSYTKYDPLARIIEVGEKTTASAMTNTISRNQTSLLTWLAGGTQKQIIRTFYDTITRKSLNKVFAGIGQQNLRTRVASVTYSENYSHDTLYNYATHYTYDIHGSVNMIIQDFPELDYIKHRYKKIEYNYDLISGKVNDVYYQPNQVDQFIHRYIYDKDNRLRRVSTSTDSIIWDKEVEYSYYRHGPLSRENIGRLNVQGMDYAYTLHGWIKGVNSDMLNPTKDIGRDGYNGTPGSLHRWVARDVYGYSLGYYNSDYSPVGGQNFTATINYNSPNKSGLTDASLRKDLYNGNIAHMVTAISQFMTGGQSPIASVYTYDQLNRLKQVTAFNNLDMATYVWGTANTGMGKYKNTFTYDANGNIITQRKDRDGSNGFTSMDQLTYNYIPNTNKLDFVIDGVALHHDPEDIDNQTPGNYNYDAIGNLVYDRAEEIAEIKWNVQGKITEIARTPGSTKPNIIFAYDAMGNRVSKTVKPTTNPTSWQQSWYVRDAQGNVMATYTSQYKEEELEVKQSDYDIFIAATKNVVGITAYNNFIKTKYCSNGSFITALRNQLLTNNKADIIYNQYTALWFADRDAGIRAIVPGYFSDDDLVMAVLQSNNRIVTDYLFTPGNNNQALLQDFLQMDCHRFLTEISNASGGIMLLQHLYNIFYPGQPFPPVPNAINDLCMHPPGALAQEIDNYNNYYNGGMICSEAISYYGANEIFDALQRVNASLFFLRAHLSSQPDIVSILYSYDAALVNTAVFAQSASYLLDIVIANDACGMVDKALVNANTSALINNALKSSIPVNSFAFDVKTYFGQPTYQQIITQTYGASTGARAQFKIQELHMYGSKRLGVLNRDSVLRSVRYSANRNATTGDLDLVNTLDTTITVLNDSLVARLHGSRQYELSNHLGNVMVTISDRRLRQQSGVQPDSAAYVNADVITAQDYYAFGSIMPGRKWSLNSAKYKYGFNGHEKDNDIKGEGNSYDFGARIQDPRLGRFLSVDPYTSNFATQSPFVFAGNSPISHIDRDGKFAQLIIQYGINVGINIMTQMVTAYMLDPNVNSWEEAWDKTSLFQAFGEGAVDMIGTKKFRMAANAVMGMATYADQVGMDNVNTQGLMISGMIGLLEPIVGDAIAKYGSKATVQGLKKMDIDYGTIMKVMGGGVRTLNKTVNGITSKRMMKGWSDKVAVIGRDMEGRVKKFAAGMNAETFNPSEEAMKAFNKGDDKLLMQENKAWIDKLKDEGYTIYDTGTGPISDQKGKYYGMETEEVFGDTK